MSKPKGKLIGVQAFQCGLDHDGLTSREYAESVRDGWRNRDKQSCVFFRSISVDTLTVYFEVVVVREKIK